MSVRTGVRQPAPPALPPDGDEGGGGRWSRVVVARDGIEAELIRGVLECADVPVVLDRRDSSPFAWMHPGGNVSAPVGVMVPAALIQPARLALLEANLIVPDEPVPPSPASSGGRRAVRLVVAGLVVLMVAAYVIFQAMGGAVRLPSG